MSDQSRQVTETFSVAPQISVADVADAAARGVKLIINNRPDGEMIGQPTSAEIEAAAKAASVSYTFIPVDQRGISEAHLDAFDKAIAEAGGGDVLAYCRSGTRSITLRSYAAARGGMPADAIIAEAAEAGYDLEGHRPALEAIGASE